MNSEQAARHSQRAADSTEELERIATQAYLDQRHATARDMRAKELRNLAEAKTLQAKIAAAASYLAAFEFHYWKERAIQEDTLERRKALFAEAVLEFFRSVQDFLPADRRIAAPSKDPQSPTPASTLSLLAIAAALHKIDPRQLETAEAHGFEPRSMLDLIARGLQAKSEAEAGKAGLSGLEAYQAEVLKWEPDAIYLLQNRYNLLAAAALDEVATPEAVGPVLKGEKDKWAPDATKLQNVARVQGAIERMLLALQTRNILMSIGEKPELENQVAKLYATLDSRAESKGAGEKGSPRAAKVAELINLMASLGAAAKP